MDKQRNPILIETKWMRRLSEFLLRGKDYGKIIFEKSISFPKVQRKRHLINFLWTKSKDLKYMRPNLKI